ncbi:MAG: decaprenyl-phosphate phosphoribosyltransferase [Geothermobacteraceae bacterium]
MIAFWGLIRPHQWLKNLLLLFPPFLAGRLLGESYSLPGFLFPVFCFCLASSATYIVNDILDVDLDRRHPRKCQRPLASGKISVSIAWGFALCLVALSVSLGFLISVPFLIYVFVYLAVSLAYSFHLKNISLVELFCVVNGFLLRLLAGGEAYKVEISDWLFLSVFLLALFLVAGKRLSELRHEGGETPENIRPVLASYPRGFLEGVMLLSGAAVLVTYTIYVIDHARSIWVIPICCFGLLAFFRRVLSGHGGDPTRALLQDPTLMVTSLLWVLFVGWETYGLVNF